MVCRSRIRCTVMRSFVISGRIVRRARNRFLRLFSGLRNRASFLARSDVGVDARRMIGG